MTPPMTPEDVAQVLGLSTSRFYHVWRAYVRDRSFPAPFRSPPQSNLAWDAGEVADWKARRARCGLAPRTAANDINPHIHPLDQNIPSSAVATNPRLQRERDELRRMMRGA